MMYFLVDFLILRVMIRYHIMIPLLSLSSLIDMPYQIFANMAYMILAMIFPLWLVLYVNLESIIYYIVYSFYTENHYDDNMILY
jgi:hypothetical protein